MARKRLLSEEIVGFLSDSADSLADSSSEEEFSEDDPTSDVMSVPDHRTSLWNKVLTEPQKPEFNNRHSGQVPHKINGTREVDFFTYFFDMELILAIAEETNDFHHLKCQSNPISPCSRTQRWKDVSAKEIYVFLALTMLMPFAKKRAIKEYWQTKNTIPTPIFGRNMSRNRYALLLQYLHFSRNVERPPDPTYKLGKVLPYLKNKIRSAFIPHQKVNIDESLVLFRGRIHFRQFIPSKRSRFGMKVFVLCDCETGIVLDHILYTGKLDLYLNFLQLLLI